MESNMRPIPPKMRAEIEKDPRMKRCTLSGADQFYGRCDTGRPEWHHVWIYAGRQINEPWAIMPACHAHHAMVTQDKAIRMAFEAGSLLIATEAQLAEYPRKDWVQIKRTLGLKHHEKKNRN